MNSSTRSVVVRVLAVLGLAVLVTACIFDESNYQGGGRKDQRSETDQSDTGDLDDDDNGSSGSSGSSGGFDSGSGTDAGGGLVTDGGVG